MNEVTPVPAAGPLDWSLVQVFLVLYETGSLGRAASVLGSSQPTLSRRLADLEQSLGQALFERTVRGLVPTSAARALRVPAERMREEAERLSRAADSHARTIAGTVRLTASQAVSVHVLPPILRALRDAQPQIQIELVASDTEEDLLARDADIAVRMFRPRQASLTVKRLADMPLGLYAHRDYLARRGMPRADALAAHDWIGQDRADDLLRGFAAAGHPVSREFFAFRCDNTLVTWAGIASGLGIGVALQAAAERTPGLVRVLPELPVPALPTWLAVHRELRGTPRLRVVFAALSRALGGR